MFGGANIFKETEKKSMSTKQRKRDKRVDTWVTQEEKDLILERAKTFNLNLSQYVRNILIGNIKDDRKKVIKEYTFSDETAKQMHYEINQIGNNINQIAYNSNIKSYVDKKMIDGLIENYDVLIEQFVKWIDKDVEKG